MGIVMTCWMILMMKLTSGSGCDDAEGKRRATDDACDGDYGDDADDHDGVWC